MNSLVFTIGTDKLTQTYSIDCPLESWYLDDRVPRCSACQEVVYFAWDSPPDGALAMCGCNRAADWRRVLLDFGEPE
jgi:hypothetical protein